MVRQGSSLIFTGAILIISCYAVSREWNEKNLGDMELQYSEGEEDKLRCLDPLEDVCENNDDMANSLMGNLIRKKSGAYNFGEVPGNTRVIPYFYRTVHHGPSCSCKMDYKLHNLGPAYYPRFLQHGVCKPDSCGNHQRCMGKNYTVMVLKQKDFTNLETTSNNLPPSLRDSWISERVSISVACECVSRLSPI